MKKDSLRIGLYGGTFDPPHFGHIHLAITLCEIHDLDEVWFIPNRLSPMKKERPTPAKDRLHMLKLAIRPIKKFKIIDYELKRRRIPSYTIDTVQHLTQLHPNNKFFILIGNDHLSTFDKWKDAKEILNLAEPLIGLRIDSVQLPKNQALAKILKEGLTPMPILEISASQVRQRLKKSAYCGHLLPHKVLDYIKDKGLYYNK